MNQEEFYHHILKNNRITHSSVTEIYYNNIIQARIDALLDVYPATTACLSEDYIKQIALDFCKTHDAPYGDLNLYGRDFGYYLSNLSACQPYDFIRDLAEFEYQVRCMLYCHDLPRLTGEQFLTTLQDNSKSIKLSHAAIGFFSEYPVSEIADFCLEKIAVKPTNTSKENFYLLFQDYYSYHVFVKPINKTEMQLIPRLKINGVLSLPYQELEKPSTQQFINFLTAQNLWI